MSVPQMWVTRYPTFIISETTNMQWNTCVLVAKLYELLCVKRGQLPFSQEPNAREMIQQEHKKM